MAVLKSQPQDALARLTGRLRPAPLPEAPRPMLCTLVAEPFDNPAWIFEPKFDGLRVLGRFDGHNLVLLSRNNQSQNFQFPDVAAALRASLSRPALVDGEVVCFDERGRTSFRTLQQRFHLKDPAEVQTRLRKYPAYIYLFDLLYADRYDLTALLLEERKRLLREQVAWSDRVRWTEHQPNAGKALWRQACRDGREGIVGKQLRSPYVPGRSDFWVKVKCLGKQEFVVGGFTDPQRSRVGLGALLVGYYGDDGRRLLYAGKVGTGYTRATLLELRRRLDGLGQRTSPFDADGPSPRETAHWVRPELVAEIAFAEWTQNGLLRQPRFEGLRTDKKPTECRRERPRDNPDGSAAGRRTTRRGSARDNDHGGPTMALEAYRNKRDFRQTSEPEGRVEAGHPRPIFVIQEHHASRLHYDFRLEADGVLKSWAVPKEPSLDPSQKRLAVRVEDHPLGYASFEGTIPEGQYGAGTVSIWDRGTYTNLLADKAEPRTVGEGIDVGRLEFELHGQKLRGRFALIRMKGRRRGGKDDWLLIKMKDDFARPDRAAGEKEAPAPKPAARKGATASPPLVEGGSESARGGVTVTHADKVWYPDDHITKGEVVEFYRRIAPRLLPHLRDRPVTLERLPDGIGAGKPHFWQKDTPASYPDWIPRVELPSERGKPVRYALVNDLETLLYLVNQGAVTFHVWFSRVQDLDRPDLVLFDLDPGQADFANVVAVARRLHEILEDEGSQTSVKTSGKTGLHVLIPWTSAGGYDEARGWAEEMAARVVQALPDRATVERSKAKRQGHVYVDVMQNARGHHAVPPYVLRPVPGAPVSTPLSWREVTPELDPSRFNLKTIFRRLARRRRDPTAAPARAGGRGRADSRKG